MGLLTMTKAKTSPKRKSVGKMQQDREGRITRILNLKKFQESDEFTIQEVVHWLHGDFEYSLISSTLREMYTRGQISQRSKKMGMAEYILYKRVQTGFQSEPWRTVTNEQIGIESRRIGLGWKT